MERRKETPTPQILLKTERPLTSLINNRLPHSSTPSSASNKLALYFPPSTIQHTLSPASTSLPTTKLSTLFFFFFFFSCSSPCSSPSASASACTTTYRPRPCTSVCTVRPRLR